MGGVPTAPHATAAQKATGRQLRAVWNAADGTGRGLPVRPSGHGLAAEAALARIAEADARSAPRGTNAPSPEGRTVFSLPETHWRRRRAAEPIEHAIQQELKRRTRKIRVFPDAAALERLATAILVESDEEWIATARASVTMTNGDE